MLPNVHCSTIYGSQDTETTSVSINRGMDKDVVHICNGILRNHKKNDILPFAAIQVDSEGIMLSEQVRQRKTNTYITYMWKQKRQQTLMNITKKQQTHRYREQTSSYQWRKLGGAQQGCREREAHTIGCRLGQEPPPSGI